MKALLLFSGGLDSMLAAEMLQAQGIEVTGLVFNSYFFDDEKAKESAKEVGIKLISKDFSKKHLVIVKNPKFGHGSSVNPCIDCHALMLSVGKEMFEKDDFDIFATGEVLSQRPFSQNKRAFDQIEKATGLEGRILRPVSARCLPETVYEKEKLVDRDKLGKVTGKSRKAQMELVEEYEIEKFPSPGGGCRLTEKEFGVKVREILPFSEFTDTSDFELLRLGRHFWFRNKDNSLMYHAMLGRNKEENKKMEALAKKGDSLITIEDEKGPTALVRLYGEADSELENETRLAIKKQIWFFAKRKDEFDENKFNVHHLN
ncbi:tRNA 4-thiouridine(8) synthase ThiI [bacterium]|jgi:tRNA-uridine 2-sulfurtransferase|nr:tRNA 4-thiouridine(8) synthase ThiI [bacterium]MBT4598251.1 tRNA 4-thiouridine(8) synthase ThiI [bacterium]MBT7037904.1 tRNA 4-thiouridine(8) synthase ThiI [bacterium]MBT7431888.1 tRNA 4-thiouridine(8) synthase ThiI [bacterium]MBT7993175.1 tRNA 4-thiouridine(8) synthase ThiI [bacterium]